MSLRLILVPIMSVLAVLLLIITLLSPRNDIHWQRSPTPKLEGTTMNQSKSIYIRSLYISCTGHPVISFCNETMTPLIIHKYSLSPPQSVLHETVTLSVSVTLKKTVTDGTVDVSHILGNHIVLHHNTTNLCDEINKFHVQCPVKPQHFQIEYTVTIPPIIYPEFIGTNVVSTARLIVNDQNDDILLCVDASIRL